MVTPLKQHTDAVNLMSKQRTLILPTRHCLRPLPGCSNHTIDHEKVLYYTGFCPWSFLTPENKGRMIRSIS